MGVGLKNRHTHTALHFMQSVIGLLKERKDFSQHSLVHFTVELIDSRIDFG